MGIGHIFIIWILSASLQPPYSSVDPTGLVVPFALITLLNRSTGVKTSTTTTSTITPPSEITTNVQSTTREISCITCELYMMSPERPCGLLGCDDDLTTGQCRTKGGGPPVTMTCGQIETQFDCNFVGCIFDANAGTYGPSDQDLTCSRIGIVNCENSLQGCCEVVGSECV